LALAFCANAWTQERKEARSTGLPSKINWTFNLDAAGSYYSFTNSLYTNPRDEPSGNLSDNWVEGFVKSALSASYGLKSSELYGKISVVGARTHGAAGADAPGLVGGDADSYKPEDLYIGWRSGTAFSGLGENAVDLTFGRTQYQLGHGFLVYDGAGEGGSRGGYWSNARKAFALAGVGRLNTGPHKLELFYLDKDELPEADSESRLLGGNYEISLAERLTLGATYMSGSANDTLKPGRDGLNVYDFRLYTTPIANVPLYLEGEYAIEDNGDKLDAAGWYAQASYQLEQLSWQPTLYYRYASFQGDDPATDKNEAFDPLFLGFYDWGAWWQGEIAGEYFISNSNMLSHHVRIQVTPSKSVSTGLIGYVFKVDQPGAVAPGLTSDAAVNEIDWYMDWKINSNFTASLVGAWASPGEAVELVYGRSEDFTYVMLYLGYSY
jgi:hypothetical protein